MPGRDQAGRGYPVTESKIDPQGFWDKRAETFPRYSGEDDSYEVRMLRLAEEGGALIKNKRVLDVGCGSGLYSIGLALEAAELTALDISAKMLNVLRLEAAKRGLGNIKYVQSDWLEFRQSPQWGFDLIFCSMNPVFRDEAARERLKLFAPVQVVYIGWAAPMRSDVTAGLYEKYALNPEAVVDVWAMKQWLERNDFKPSSEASLGSGVAGSPERPDSLGRKSARRHYSARPVSGSWAVPFSLDQMKCNSINTLNNYGIKPDPDWLDEYLKKFRQDDGSYLEKTLYQVEMIIFGL